MDNVLLLEKNKWLETVNQASMLTTKNIDSLKELSTELYETFVKTQIHRTRTEMEISVLNDIKFPTPALKYWQAMREQNVMFTELIALSFEYRKNQIEIKILERDLVKECDTLEGDLIQVEIDKKRFIVMQQERTAEARMREIQNWSEIKEREANNMTKEELAEVDNSQLIGYTKRWINQVIIMGDSGSPSERQNLLGQLKSGILACVDKDILGEVLKGFDFQIQNKIKEEYKI